MRHANERFYLTPDTREIVLDLARAFGGTFATSQPCIELEIKRRLHGSTCLLKWQAYALDDERKAHFEIPEELTVNEDKFPRGFYDIRVMVNKCHFADIEMIKAPGYYVEKVVVNETDGTCDNGKWLEPSCEEYSGQEVAPFKCPDACEDGSCGCLYDVKDNCPSCLTTYEIATVTIAQGYGT